MANGWLNRILMESEAGLTYCTGKAQLTQVRKSDERQSGCKSDKE